MAVPTEIHKYLFDTPPSTTSAGIRYVADAVGSEDINAYSAQLLDFNGTNQYVKRASHANMDNFSVEIYGILGTDTSHAYLFAKRDGGTTDYGITKNGTTFDIWLSGGSDTIPDITASAGDFVHIILTCDVSNNIVVSINKVEKSSFTTKTPARNNAIDTFFAARGDGVGGATLFCDHQLGGYILYNRVLTTTEKEYRYDNLESAVKMAKGGTDTGTTVVTADIVECIPFIDGTGTSTVAELVNPSTATMYNFSGSSHWTNADRLQQGLQRVAIQPDGDVVAVNTFEADGNIYFDDSAISNATYSVLIFINPTTVSGTQQLLDARAASGVGQIYLSGSTLTASSGTTYINGAAGSTVTAATWQSIGIAGITLNATSIRYIMDYLDANGFTGSGGIIAFSSGAESAANMLDWHNTYKALYIAGGTSYTGSATFDISGSVAATSMLSNTGAATLDITGSMVSSSTVSNTGSSTLDISGTMESSANVSNTSTATFSISGSTVLSSIVSNTGSGTLTISGSMVSTSSTDDQASKAIYTITIEDVPKYEIDIQSVAKYETTIANTPKYTIEITYGGETMNYDRGSIPIIRATIKKAEGFDAGVLFDPASVTVTVTDPNSVVKVTTAAMTKSETGKYYYYLQTAKDWAEGLYQVDVDISDSGDADVTVDKDLYLK